MKFQNVTTNQEITVLKSQTYIKYCFVINKGQYDMVSLLFLKVQISMHVLYSHLIIPGIFQISLNMTNHQYYQTLTLAITKPIFRKTVFWNN